ncbi:hypothetical protein MHYP_G00345650 [Metynnis hypsauchen]
MKKKLEEDEDISEQLGSEKTGERLDNHNSEVKSFGWAALHHVTPGLKTSPAPALETTGFDVVRQDDKEQNHGEDQIQREPLKPTPDVGQTLASPEGPGKRMLERDSKRKRKLIKKLLPVLSSALTPVPLITLQQHHS